MTALSFCAIQVFLFSYLLNYPSFFLPFPRPQSLYIPIILSYFPFVSHSLLVLSTLSPLPHLPCLLIFPFLHLHFLSALFSIFCFPPLFSRNLQIWSISYQIWFCVLHTYSKYSCKRWQQFLVSRCFCPLCMAGHMIARYEDMKTIFVLSAVLIGDRKWLNMTSRVFWYIIWLTFIKGGSVADWLACWTQTQ